MTDTLAPDRSVAAPAAANDARASSRATAPTPSPIEAAPVEEVPAEEVPAEGEGVEPRAGLGAAHLVLLGAVAAVLATLTLTRLQLFAVYENERDAVDLVERLGRGLDLRSMGSEVGGSTVTTATLAPAAATLRDAVLAAEVRVGNPADAVWLDDGRLLRRRGYLFDLATDEDGRACVRAWPWRAGATGAAVYAWVPGEGLLGHTNGVVDAKDPAPLWTGLGAPPELVELDAAWMELDDSRSLALASRMP